MTEISTQDLILLTNLINMLTGACVLLSGLIALFEVYEKNPHGDGQCVFYWPLPLVLALPLSLLLVSFHLGSGDSSGSIFHFITQKNLAARTFIGLMCLSLSALVVFLSFFSLINRHAANMVFAFTLIFVSFFVKTHHIHQQIGEIVIQYNSHIDYLLSLTLALTAFFFLLKSYTQSIIYQIPWCIGMLVNGALKIFYIPRQKAMFQFSVGENDSTLIVYLAFVVITVIVIGLVFAVHLLYKHVFPHRRAK